MSKEPKSFMSILRAMLKKAGQKSSAAKVGTSLNLDFLIETAYAIKRARQSRNESEDNIEVIFPSQKALDEFLKSMAKALRASQ